MDISYYAQCVDTFTDAFDDIVDQYNSVSNPPTQDQRIRLAAVMLTLDTLYDNHKQRLADDGLSLEESYLFGAWTNEVVESIHDTRRNLLNQVEEFLEKHIPVYSPKKWIQ
jgi:acyl-CoA-binding protein